MKLYVLMDHWSEQHFGYTNNEDRVRGVFTSREAADTAKETMLKKFATGQRSIGKHLIEVEEWAANELQE